MVWNGPLVSLEQLSQRSTPEILPSPSLLGEGRECWRERLDAVRALLSSSQNTLLATNTKHSTMRAAMGKINSTAATLNAVSTVYPIPLASCSGPT